jgi:hypothetical protein
MSGSLDCDLPGEGDRILDRLFMKAANVLKDTRQSLDKPFVCRMCNKITTSIGKIKQ